MQTYWDSLKSSWIWEELRRARNYRPVKYCLLISNGGGGGGVVLLNMKLFKSCTQFI